MGTHYAMDESGTSCAEHGEGLLSIVTMVETTADDSGPQKRIVDFWREKVFLPPTAVLILFWSCTINVMLLAGL